MMTRLLSRVRLWRERHRRRHRPCRCASCLFFYGWPPVTPPSYLTPAQLNVSAMAERAARAQVLGSGGNP